MVFTAIALYWGERTENSWSPRTIILIAAFARLLFLFRAPELSDDIYRYLWDGLMVLGGHNPYSLAPTDATPPGGATTGLLGLVNHPRLITIYPPSAQIVFAAGAYVGGVFGIKTVLVAMDIAACAVILKILSHLKMPPSRAVIYAWHPLPVLEIASSGHIDAAAVFFLMLAVLAIVIRLNDAPSLRAGATSALAGAFFAIASLVKLFPLVFLPAFVFLMGKKGRIPFLLGMAAGMAAITVPFLPDLRNMFVTLEVYARNWEFAGFAYRSLARTTASGHAARMILAVAFVGVAASLYAALFRGTGNHRNHPGFNGRFQATAKTLYWIAAAFLLLTPTLHPWYALYLAALLPFYPGTAGIALTWGVFLSYRIFIPFSILGVWKEDDIIPAVIWLGAIATAIATWLAKRRFHPAS